MCRRPTRACSRSAATWPPASARWCSRTSCSSSSNTSRSTAKVHERPMLFVPPCINKYYILDLQPENSLIRYTVEQGHRTFVISWRNPDDRWRPGRWDDYIEQGPITRHPRRPGDQRSAARSNALGFCVGGTILATALAVLAARGEQPAHQLTLLTTLLDFSRHRRARPVHRRADGADARDDAGRSRRPTAPACSRARNWPPPSASCAPTTWSGTTSWATTSRAKRRRRSTCCTGTATHQPARPDVLLVPAPHLPAKRIARSPASSPSAARRSTWVEHRGAGLRLRLARRPHRAVEGGAYEHSASLQGQTPLRARCVGPHRRRDQPAGGKSKRSYWVDDKLAGTAQGLARLGQRAAWQLVARLDGLAQAQRRQAGPRTEGHGNRKSQGHRTCARPLRQGQSLK